jgi:hypothetical protein
MVVAIYRSNRRIHKEEIIVNQREDQTLYIEVVNASEWKKLPGRYNTLQEIETYLQERDPMEGYKLINSRI